MLEKAVSSALYRLTLLEKALHSPEDWSLSVGAERIAAERVVTDTGVAFRASFPTHAGDEVPIVSLWCGEDLMGTRPLSHADGPIDVEWAIRLSSGAVAA